MLNKFKKNIIELKRIDDFFDERYEYLRLEKNERLLKFHKDKFKKFVNKINSSDFSGYSEIGTTYSKLSKYLKIKRNEILLTAGSDLAIKTVFECIIESGDEVIMHNPGYAMSRIYSNMFGARIIDIGIDDNMKIQFDDIYEKITKKTKLVIIENPNGFTGQKPNYNQLSQLIKFLNRKKIFILIDEAYVFLSKKLKSYKIYINKFDNLLVSLSFSKAHGLAGVRAGCLISNNNNMKVFKNSRPMHEISSITSLSLKWVIEDKNLLSEYLEDQKESKKFIFKELKKLNIRFVDTFTNFILIDFSVFKKINVREYLYNNKILVRRPFDNKKIDNWTRVCIPDYKSAKKFISVLKKI